MRIGVFGGTFDPIHLGHLVAGQEVCSRLDLEKVLFVPTGVPPHKLNEQITAVEHRLAMVELAIASNPCFELSRVDVDRPGPSYTVDTLQLLLAQWPSSTKPYFIMGLDSLAEITTWHRPERLIQLCRLAVVGRPGYNADLTELEAALPGISSRIECVPMPWLEISSTDLQRRVRQGISIKYLVPEAVEKYIYQHGLYRIRGSLSGALPGFG